MLTSIKFRNIQDISYNINFYERLIFITGDNSHQLVEPFYELKMFCNSTTYKTPLDNLSSIEANFIDTKGFNNKYKIIYNREGIKYELLNGITTPHNPYSYRVTLDNNLVDVIKPIIIDLNSKQYIEGLYSILLKELREDKGNFRTYLIVYLEKFNIHIRDIEILDNDILYVYSDTRIIKLREHSKEVVCASVLYSTYLAIFSCPNSILYINSADELGKEYLEIFIQWYLKNINQLQLIINTNSPYFVGVLNNTSYTKPKFKVNENQIIRSQSINNQLLCSWK